MDAPSVFQLWTHWRQRVLSVAFVLLALAAANSRLLSQAATATPSSDSTMEHFVIIFRQGPRVLSDAEKVRRQQEVSAWARGQNEAGHNLEPRILGPEARRSGPVAGAEGDVGPNSWPITALLFLVARDLDEAVRVAASHPANNYGVCVEVRPWGPPVAPADAGRRAP